MAGRGPRGGERARTVPSWNDRHGGRAGAIRVSTRRTDAPPDNPVCGGPRTGKEQRPPTSLGVLSSTPARAPARRSSITTAATRRDRVRPTITAGQRPGPDFWPPQDVTWTSRWVEVMTTRLALSVANVTDLVDLPVGVDRHGHPHPGPDSSPRSSPQASSTYCSPRATHDTQRKRPGVAVSRST